MTDITAQRPAPAYPARVLYAVAAHAANVAGLLTIAALAGAITGYGPTASITDTALITVIIAFFGASYMVADAAESWADRLTRDESSAADDAADALAEIANDLGQGADPELVLAGLRRASLPGQLADIVSQLQDQAPTEGDAALTMAADHLRQAQHHLTYPHES